MVKADRHVWAPLLLALSLAACGDDGKSSGVMDRDKFVAANVAVRILPADATDADRAGALKKQGVSEKELKAWVAAHARDPETLSLTWEAIAHKVDSLTNRVPPGPPPGAVDPPPGMAGAPPSPPLEADLPPLVRARRDSLARLGGGRGPGMPRPGRPPVDLPVDRPRPTPPPEAGPPDPRIAPVQAPIAPARPAKPPR